MDSLMTRQELTAGFAALEIGERPVCAAAGVYAALLYLDQMLELADPQGYEKREISSERFGLLLGSSKTGWHLHRSGLEEIGQALQAHPDLAEGLWRALTQANLIADPAKFYRNRLLCVAADLRLCAKIREEVSASGRFRTAALIHEMLLLAGETGGTAEVLQLNSTLLYEAHREIFTFLKIPQERMEALWDGLWFREIDTRSKPAHRDLASAISFYGQLFSDRAEATKYLIEEYMDAHDRYADYYMSKQIPNCKPSEMGAEDRMHHEAYRISRLPASHVVQKTMYEGYGRDDSAFECSWLLDWIRERKQCAGEHFHLLLINPGPMLLDAYDREWKGNPQKTSFVILDDRERRLYIRDYPQYGFYSPTNFAGATGTCDCAVLIARDCGTSGRRQASDHMPQPSLHSLYPLLNACAADSEVLLMLP